jgi:hypothetical protein
VGLLFGCCCCWDRVCAWGGVCVPFAPRARHALGGRMGCVCGCLRPSLFELMLLAEMLVCRSFWARRACPLLFPPSLLPADWLSASSLRLNGCIGVCLCPAVVAPPSDAGSIARPCSARAATAKAVVKAPRPRLVSGFPKPSCQPPWANDCNAPFGSSGICPWISSLARRRLQRAARFAPFLVRQPSDWQWPNGVNVPRSFSFQMI